MLLPTMGCISACADTGIARKIEYVSVLRRRRRTISSNTPSPCRKAQPAFTQPYWRYSYKNTVCKTPFVTTHPILRLSLSEVETGEGVHMMGDEQESNVPFCNVG